MSRIRSEVKSADPETYSLSYEKWNVDYDYDAKHWFTFLQYAYDVDPTEFSAWTTSRWMEDVVTPNFKKAVAKGEIINNPMTKIVTSTTDALAYFEKAKMLNYYAGDVLVGGTGEKWFGPMPSSKKLGAANGNSRYAADPSIDIERLRDLAVTQSFANIDLSQAQMLATLGESSSTVTSLTSIFKRAIKIFKAVRKLDVRALKREIKPKELADRYMELRYAIRPLIYDAAMIMEAYTAPLTQNNRFTYRGYASEESDTLVDDIVFYESTDYDLIGTAHTIRKVEARAGVLVQVDRVSALNKWGLDQPVETVWELTPFSFIADWFFNIGQTLASFTPEVGTRNLASWCVVNDSIHRICRCTSTVNKMDPSYYTYDCKILFDGAEISEKVISSQRYVQPRRSFIPSFKLRLNAFKILDLAIIIKKLTMK